MFLFMFWFGILVISVRKKWDLKARSQYYLGRISAGVQLSAPYKAWKRILAARDKEKMLSELAQSLAYIRNITILGRGKSISAELLLEELSELCPVLSDVYLDMARSISVNDKEHAAEALYIAMGEGFAQDIGNFLAGWEDVPQSELLGSIETYSQALRQERTTRIRKRDETISDLIYLPVVVNCMAILLNFIYVAYFVEQKEALMGLF